MQNPCARTCRDVAHNGCFLCIGIFRKRCNNGLAKIILFTKFLRKKRTYVKRVYFVEQIIEKLGNKYTRAMSNILTLPGYTPMQYQESRMNEGRMIFFCCFMHVHGSGRKWCEGVLKQPLICVCVCVYIIKDEFFSKFFKNCLQNLGFKNKSFASSTKINFFYQHLFVLTSNTTNTQTFHTNTNIFP